MNSFDPASEKWRQLCFHDLKNVVLKTEKKKKERKSLSDHVMLSETRHILDNVSPANRVMQCGCPVFSCIIFFEIICLFFLSIKVILLVWFIFS